MSKFDISNAFKVMPIKVSQWPYFVSNGRSIMSLLD